LTGDSLYPGKIRVADWQDYRNSINRLSEFVQQRTITAILGGHIEMGRSGKMYKIGTTFQPSELPLALGVDDLLALNQRLNNQLNAGTLKFQKFEISPLSWFEKQLAKMLKAVSGD
jgi:hypothetical protein